MGQILACGALIRSHIFHNAADEEKQKILEILINAGNKRSYLSLAAYMFINDLIDKVKKNFNFCINVIFICFSLL